MDGSFYPHRSFEELPTNDEQLWTSPRPWWPHTCAQDPETLSIHTSLEDPHCHDSYMTIESEQFDPGVVICTVTCDDPDCPESDCAEDLVECTEASCSPPPAGPSACHGNNTICAGSISPDVLNGAVSLQALRPPATYHQYTAQSDQFTNLPYTAASGNFPRPISYEFSNCGLQNFTNEYTCHPQLHPNENALRTFASTEDFVFNNSDHIYPGWNFALPAEQESQIPFSEPMLTESSSCSSFSPVLQKTTSFSTESTPCTASPYMSPLQTLSNTVSPQSHALPIQAATNTFSKSPTCMWEVNSSVICGHSFQGDSELQTHVQSAHTARLRKSDGFYCMWRGCARMNTGKDGFAQRSKLDRHIQSHTGYKAETCPDCGQQCSTAQSLILHQRTHSGEKPHKCKEPGCNYAAAQASQLTMHTRTRHSKEKPLHCPFPGCTATFAESSNLSKHKKIHLPEAICECHLCPKTFHREDQLKRHLKTHVKRAQTDELQIGQPSIKRTRAELDIGQMQNSAEGQATFAYIDQPTNN